MKLRHRKSSDLAVVAQQVADDCHYVMSNLDAHHRLAWSATSEALVFPIYCHESCCFLTCDTLSISMN